MLIIQRTSIIVTAVKDTTIIFRLKCFFSGLGLPGLRSFSSGFLASKTPMTNYESSTQVTTGSNSKAGKGSRSLTGIVNGNIDILH